MQLIMQKIKKCNKKKNIFLLKNVRRNDNFRKMWHVKGGNSYKTRYLFVSRGIL